MGAQPILVNDGDGNTNLLDPNGDAVVVEEVTAGELVGARDSYDEELRPYRPASPLTTGQYAVISSDGSRVVNFQVDDSMGPVGVTAKGLPQEQPTPAVGGGPLLH